MIRFLFKQFYVCQNKLKLRSKFFFASLVLRHLWFLIEKFKFKFKFFVTTSALKVRQQHIVLSSNFHCFSMAVTSLISLTSLGEKSNIPTSILRNTVRNISNILGYSGIFARNISVILIVFCAEYVGIRYTRYSEAEYCSNTTSANNL